MRTTRPAGFEEAAALIPARLRPGVMTNLASPEALRGESLELMETDGGLFILRKRDGFRLLTFFMNKPGLPEIDGTVVSEAVFPPVADDSALTEVFSAAGYVPALRRLRLTRGPDAVPEASRAAPGGENRRDHPVFGGGQRHFGAGSEGVPEPLRASQDDLGRASEILRNCFSPLTGCLPGDSELSGDLSSGRVLAAMEGGELAGVLRYKITGKQAEIRHLAVDAPFRGRGLSERLIDGFIHDAAGLRLSVWTGAENAPALAAYSSRGFVPDGRYSIVYLKGV